MKIDLDKVSKKYGNQWIFRSISTSFESGGTYAITGLNGSGKSTLLKVISGITTPNEGSVKYSHNGSPIDVTDIYKYISYSAPYLDLPEELTIAEMIDFHKSLKTLHDISAADLLKVIDMPGDKEIRDCSSGMKQRLKFALAYYTQSDILLLDEPTANMDHQWRDWALYHIRASTQTRRLTIICSNEDYEHDFAEIKIRL